MGFQDSIQGIHWDSKKNNMLGTLTPKEKISLATEQNYRLRFAIFTGTIFIILTSVTGEYWSYLYYHTTKVRTYHHVHANGTVDDDFKTKDDDYSYYWEGSYYYSGYNGSYTSSDDDYMWAEETHPKAYLFWLTFFILSFASGILISLIASIIFAMWKIPLIPWITDLLCTAPSDLVEGDSFIVSSAAVFAYRSRHFQLHEGQKPIIVGNDYNTSIWNCFFTFFIIPFPLYPATLLVCLCGYSTYDGFVSDHDLLKIKYSDNSETVSFVNEFVEGAKERSLTLAQFKLAPLSIFTPCLRHVLKMLNIPRYSDSIGDVQECEPFKKHLVSFSIYTLLGLGDLISDCLFVYQLRNTMRGIKDGDTSLSSRDKEEYADNNLFFIICFIFLLLPIAVNLLLAIAIGRTKLIFADTMLSYIHLNLEGKLDLLPTSLMSQGIKLLILPSFNDGIKYIYHCSFYSAKCWYVWDSDNARFQTMFDRGYVNSAVSHQLDDTDESAVVIACKSLQAFFFFLYPCHLLLSSILFIIIVPLYIGFIILVDAVITLSYIVGIIVIVASNVLWYTIICSSSELTYMCYGIPQAYNMVTLAGTYVETIPQFVCQVVYSIVMQMKFGYTVSTIQWLSFAFTAWHFGYSTMYKHMNRNNRKPSPFALGDVVVQMTEIGVASA